MSAIESLITVGSSLVGSGVLVALVRRFERRDVLDAGVAKVERREDTAQRRIDDGAAQRRDAREAHLHDECRKEVADLRNEFGEVSVKLARCEEQHEAQGRENAEQRRINEDLLGRLSRVEARSNSPPAMEHAE